MPLGGNSGSGAVLPVREHAALPREGKVSVRFGKSPCGCREGKSVFPQVQEIRAKGESMLVLVVMCVCGGSLIGLLNGMLGVGGSFIAIPLLDEVLLRLGVSPSAAHVMAVGTAPATILFTCISSFLAHRALGSMRGDLLRRMGPFILVGSLAGAFLAPHMPTLFLKLLFAAVLMLMGVHLLLPQKAQEKGRENLAFLEPVSFFFGMLASMSGLAGTLICVTYLYWRGVSWRQAVGTSSGIGLVIAVTSTLGYIGSGWGETSLPAWSLGYLYLPGALCLLVPGMLMARLGAVLVNAKNMPLAAMKKGVAVMNIGMAIHVASSVWS